MSSQSGVHWTLVSIENCDQSPDCRAGASRDVRPKRTDVGLIGLTSIHRWEQVAGGGKNSPP